MPGTVFVSYAHVAGGFVTQLLKELNDEDFEVWTDKLIGGAEDWVQAIDDAIKKCFAVIVIMTPASMSSQYVTYEWSIAMGLGLKILPIMLEQCERHPKLEKIQYIDFTNFDFKWPLLIDSIIKLREDYVQTELAGSRALGLLEEGRRSREVNNLPDALQSLESALQHADEGLLDNIYYEMAMVYLALHEAENAEKALIEALRHKEDHIQSLIQLGIMHRRQGDKAETESERNRLYSDAEAKFREALKIQNNLLDIEGESVWGSLGGVLKRRNRIDDAIKAYKNAARVKRSSYPYNNLGLLYLEKGKEYEKAIKQAFTLVELFTRTKLLFDPSDEWVHNDNFIAKIVLGKTTEAEEALSTLLILAPDYALHSLLSTFDIIRESDAVKDKVKDYVEYAIKMINNRLDELKSQLI